MGGSIQLGYQTIDGVVAPDIRYVASQQQTEHITLPGIFTFSDGSGGYPTSIPQVLISGDLDSATAQFGVGTISFEALGQTIQVGDVNGVNINPFASTAIIGGSVAGVASMGGILGTPYASGGVGGSIVKSASGIAAAAGASGTAFLNSIVEGYGGVNGSYVENGSTTVLGGCVTANAAGLFTVANCIPPTATAAAAAAKHTATGSPSQTASPASRITAAPSPTASPTATTTQSSDHEKRIISGGIGLFRESNAIPFICINDEQHFL